MDGNTATANCRGSSDGNGVCDVELKQQQQSSGSKLDREPVAADENENALPSKTEEVGDDNGGVVDVVTSDDGAATLSPRLVAERHIRALPSAERLDLVEETMREFLRPYDDVALFAGESWHLPSHKRRDDEAEEEEAAADRRCCSYDAATGRLRVALLRRHVIEVRVFSYLVRAALLVLLWASLWALLPQHVMEPGGAVFDSATTVMVSGVVGGGCAAALGMPELAGIVWVSIFWNNIGPEVGYLTSGIPAMLRKNASLVGLATILTRAGMSMNLRLLRRMLGAALLFGIVPFMAEAVAHALLAQKLFEHDSYLWAFTQGFAASAVAPAVVVPGVLGLQQEGYGVASGPNFLLLSSLTIDMIIGIWGVPFLNGLIFEPEKDLGLAIAMGPVQVLVGIILGVLLGVLFYHVSLHVLLREASPLPHGRYSRAHVLRTEAFSAILLFFVNVTSISVAGFYGYTGGGAFAVVSCAAVSGHLLTLNNEATHGYSGRIKHAIAGTFQKLWDFLIMPTLFTMAGSTVVLSEVFAGDFFWRALVCITVGMLARFLLSLVSPVGLGYNNGERVFLGFGWLGKGSVQGAVASLAYLQAEEKGDAELMAKGKAVKDTCVLLLLIGAPLSAVLMKLTGPKLLGRDGKKAA